MTHRALLLPQRSSARRVIMSTERKRPRLEQTYLGKRGLLLSRAQDWTIRFWHGPWCNKLRYQGMILYQRHVHYYSERGDLLEERFALMTKKYGFHHLETVDKPKWMSEKQFCCADAQWWLGNYSQSSPASLKQLSSKSNNECREKAGPDQSKTIYGKWRLLLSRAQDPHIRIWQGPG